MSGSDEVKRDWDQIKAAERAAANAGGPIPALDGVPLHQPAVGRSDLGQELFDLVHRACALGLDPELELRSAALAYADRVRAWEAS